MSSSSVCQGLQSCLEPRVIEPRVLRLKLAPPGSNFSPPSSATTVIIPPPSSDQEKPLLVNNERDKNDTKSGGWSFLQALADNPDCKNKTKKNDNVYVHPTVKRSSSMLSEKSLEMCTESLGSETGSNAGETNDDVSLFSLHDDSTVVVLGSGGGNMNCGGVNRRVKHKACSFPPPLTSITDFHVRPHREGGRLILEAVASPSRNPCFHAERGDGRLTLCLFDDGFGSDYDDEEEEGEGGGEEEGEEEEELEECVENVEDEMDVKKFARPSRCKESGNRDIFGDGYFELPSLSLCL